MDYTIQIEGMHCKGCETLIKMGFEEHGINDVEFVKLDEKNLAKVKYENEDFESKLKEVFEDLPGYKAALI